MAFKPLAMNPLGEVVGVGTVEQHDTFGKGAVCQQTQQVTLGAARFSENDGLLFRANFLRLGKSNAQGLEQGLALGIMLDGDSQRGEGIKIRNLLLHGGAVRLGE